MDGPFINESWASCSFSLFRRSWILFRASSLDISWSYLVGLGQWGMPIQNFRPLMIL
jgi:hypothetical protein